MAAWVKQLRATRNGDGTFGAGDGQARETGSAIVALLRLGDAVSNAENVLGALKAGQRADGGFGKQDSRTSDLETSYRVMRAFYMLRAMPNTTAMKKFVSQCRNSDGGYGLALGQPSNVSATYFAASISHWISDISSGAKD